MSQQVAILRNSLILRQETFDFATSFTRFPCGVVERCGRLGRAASVGGLSLADLDAADEAARLDRGDWDAFLATYSINANPHLKKAIDVPNPLRAKSAAYRRVDLKDVPWDD